MHIILRFELEQDLIEGRLSIADLPEAWNARFKDYFGIEVTDDADGVLQDVHWSAGMIGYFPTYALGQSDCRTALGGSPGRDRRPG